MPNNFATEKLFCDSPRSERRVERATKMQEDRAATNMNKSLDAKHKSSYRMGMNKLPVAQARPNPLDALRGRRPCGRSPAWCDVSINTVSKMLVDAGTVCAAFHDEKVRNVKSKRVQVDEVWAFTATRSRRTSPTMKAALDGAGDTWTWTALDADSKLIVQWFVGGRDGYSAKLFIDDLASRLANRVQLTSDGLRAYLDAVEGRLRRRRRLCPAREALRREPGSREALQPGRVHRLPQDADRGQPRSGAHLARRMWSARTSRCACTCAGSRG